VEPLKLYLGSRLRKRVTLVVEGNERELVMRAGLRIYDPRGEVYPDVSLRHLLEFCGGKAWDHNKQVRITRKGQPNLTLKWSGQQVWSYLLEDGDRVEVLGPIADEDPVGLSQNEVVTMKVKGSDCLWQLEIESDLFDECGPTLLQALASMNKGVRLDVINDRRNQARMGPLTLEAEELIGLIAGQNSEVRAVAPGIDFSNMSITSTTKSGNEKRVINLARKMSEWDAAGRKRRVL
jgi:hypothetical protein